MQFVDVISQGYYLALAVLLAPINSILLLDSFIECLKAPDFALDPVVDVAEWVGVLLSHLLELVLEGRVMSASDQANMRECANLCRALASAFLVPFEEVAELRVVLPLLLLDVLGNVLLSIRQGRVVPLQMLERTLDLEAMLRGERRCLLLDGWGTFVLNRDRLLLGVDKINDAEGQI